MRSAYLTRAVTTALHTTSPVKPPHGLSHVLLPKAAASWTGAAISTDTEARDSLGGSRCPAPLTDATPLAEGATRPDPLMPAAQVAAENGAITRPDPTATNAAQKFRPRPYGLVSHAEMVHVAPAAKAARPDAGVLARLSRPVTRVQAPLGLRPQPGMHSQHDLAQPAHPAVSGDLLNANPSEPSRPLPLGRRQDEQPRVLSHNADLGSLAPAAPLQPLSAPTFRPAGRSESLRQHPENAGDAAPSMPASPSGFTQIRPAYAADQQGAQSRNASPNPRPLESAPAATAPQQRKRERRISIGQIDVHVNNQPGPQRSAGRTQARNQQPSNLLQSPDMSRFLLRP